ncbi:MAG: hypothetical protein ACTS6J_23650 [Burkholderiales bacterium]
MRWNLKPLAVWLAAVIIGFLLSLALMHWLEDGEEHSAWPAPASANNS